MAIETVQGDHSFNMDELLSYLLRESESRHELAVANIGSNPERSERERVMAINYQRFYQAAKHYRKQAE